MSSTPIEPDPSTTMSFGAIDVTAETDSVESSGLSTQDRQAIAALPPGTALLVVQRGGAPGARFLLDSDVTTVGRHPRSDIFLDDVTVSRKHAVFIALNSGGFGIRDSGSLNGTYVNRARIEQVELGAGDEVQIGKYRMTFHPGPISVAASR